MVAAAASPASRFGRILGWWPLRWLGVRSYGIYLWHFPIIVLTAPPGGGDTPARAILQVTATIGCAALSWRYIEEPIRHGALSRWWAQMRGNSWRLGTLGRRARIAVAASAPVLVLASCGMAGVVQSGSASPVAASKPAVSVRGPARTSCRAVVHIGDSTSEGLISPITCRIRGSGLPPSMQRWA